MRPVSDIDKKKEGDLIDITGILKDKKISEDQAVAEREKEKKLVENGVIAFERFSEFLERRRTKEIGEKYKFISQEFLDQYRGGVFEMNTTISAIAGEITSATTSRDVKERLIAAIKPDVDEILDALQEDQADLVLLVFEIESLSPSPEFILEKAERLFFLQNDVVDLYELISISTGV